MNRIDEGLQVARWSLVVLTLMVAQPLLANAQCQDATLKRAVADPGSKTISLELFPRITDKDKAIASDARAWTLVDISPRPAPTPPLGPASAATPLQITNVALAADKLFPNNFLSALLDYTGDLDPKGNYVLSNVALTFNGCKPPQPPLTPVLFELKLQSTFSSTKANGREDADLYIAGQLEGSRKTRAKQTADIKVNIPFSWNVLGRQRDIAPFFELKASNSKKSDADSLKFGASLRTNYEFEHLGLTNINWETDGRIEADRRFGNLNAVWGNTLFLIPPLLGQSSNQKVLAFLQPFVGLELGRNLKSPVKEAEHRGIARATGGASLYLLFNTGNKLLDSLSFQTDYIRRWPLRGEISFTEDDKGKLSPLFIGRNPRDYVTSKIELGINDFFGIAVGYDYGKLPPNFKLVDSHFTFGFVYKKRLVPRIK
jgi:hypothetical protein